MDSFQLGCSVTLLQHGGIDHSESQSPAIHNVSNPTINALHGSTLAEEKSYGHFTTGGMKREYREDLNY